ncbi:MAG TPA: pyridine nucleotide-disulfide oxidoreductase [Erysipelotrichaceae bacterium]|nr:pyridine nucleotide-disulfide oxidoreductase [Erysipelotrichaceae bacterium]
MRSYDYDVLFIGSGHACNHGAIALKMAGKKVAMIEEDKNGGTCTNYGCDAKILLDGPFVYQEGFARYNDLGMQTPDINWKNLMAYKKKLIGAFSPLLGQAFEKYGIEVIKGHGTLTDAHTVNVDGKNYTAEYIVIGTGARDSSLPIEGAKYMHHSKDFLDLDEMPESLLFVGAGVISMEFASMALALGKKVTVIDFAPRALAQYPSDYVNMMVKKMENLGATFSFNQSVQKVEKTDAGYIVYTQDQTFIADYIVEGTGRVANVENLGLEALGIEASRRGIVVNEYMQTSVGNIYASGDVVDKRIPKLTPTAEFESNYIAYHILGMNPNPITYPAIPNLVFTLPRIAQVGVTVDEAEAHPELYRVERIPFGVSNEWVNNREKEAHYTFILDKEGYLVGAAIYSSEATTILDFITLIINKKMTALDLASMIFAFPTQTYQVVFALKPLLKKA